MKTTWAHQNINARRHQPPLRLQTAVVNTLTYTLEEEGTVVLTSETLKERMLNVRDDSRQNMPRLLQLHDPHGHYFDQMWAYQRKEGFLGPVFGGYEMCKKKLQDRLGRKATDLVRLILCEDTGCACLAPL